MKRLVLYALLALAIVFAAPISGQARGTGRGFSGGHASAFHGRGGFEGHREFRGGRFGAFHGHRDFDDHGFRRGFHGHVFIGPSFYWGPAYPYWWDYAPGYAYVPPPPQAYWYCPSVGAYYPYVTSCPGPWVPVPSSAW